MILKENDVFAGLWNGILVSGIFYASMLSMYFLIAR